MKVIWSRLAIADLVAIRAYLGEHNPEAANGVARRILHAVELLQQQPRLGLPTHRTDVRRLIVPGTVYSLPYRVEEGTIEILEVFDGRQRAPRTDLWSGPGD